MSTLPAPAWTPLMHREADDVDEQAALLCDWQQDYAQVSGGRFSGWVDEVWLGGVHLFVEQTGRRLLQRGALRPDSLAVGVPLAFGEGPISFCGVADWQGPQRAERICTFSGASGFEFATPEGLVMAGIELPLSALHEVCMPDEQAGLARLAERAGLHAVDPVALMALRAWVRGALQVMQQSPDRLDDPVAREALRRNLLSNLLELLPLDATDDSHLAPLPQWKLVARAQAHVREDPETPHTVADLCVHLQVSRRTLQAAFQKVLGLAPATYLRAQRLAGAHRALRDARSVAEAATQWGFWHLSLFAQDHRRMFGETPSESWKRLRSAAH